MSDVDFRGMGLEEAWNYLKSEADMNDTSYQKGRFGVRMMFDINEHFMGFMKIKPKTGEVIIRDKKYKSEDFFTELELREKVIKNWLINNLTPEDIANAWEDEMIPGGK